MVVHRGFRWIGSEEDSEEDNVCVVSSSRCLESKESMMVAHSKVVLHMGDSENKTMQRAGFEKK